MTLKLKAEIEQVSESEYIACIVDNKKFRGTVVQASTYEDAHRELITSIKVKIAYDYGIEIDTIQDEELQKNHQLSAKSEQFDLVF